MIVLKIGGSLIEYAHNLLKKLCYLDYSATGREPESIIIVPGGGIFANIVRDVSQKYNISSDSAHWMAILAMEQYGFYLASLEKIKLLDDLDNIPSMSILLPYKLLKNNDELEHSWKVTSDTIAAWIAKKLKARLIKATDVDGIYIDNKLVSTISARELIGKDTCVDLALPKYLIKEKINLLVVNGKYPDRVIKAIFNKKTIGTFIRY
ncbi:MAG: amino acid kinase [Methanosarcinales archaeon]